MAIALGMEKFVPTKRLLKNIVKFLITNHLVLKQFDCAVFLVKLLPQNA